LTPQQLTSQVSIAGRAFGRLLRSHAVLRRELEAELAGKHELTTSEFEVLLLLSRAPDRKMRRVDLADEVRLSPSGITRMLDRLGEEQFVEKATCDSDARISYAVLTDKGLECLKDAQPLHFEAIDRVLGARLSDEELDQLSGLLERAAGGIEDEPCEAGE
jgi:DNA-binding MarR family transcriptional regulator